MPYGEFDFLSGDEDPYDFSNSGGGQQSRGSVVSGSEEDNLAKYMKLIQGPSASEGILSDYTSRRPDRQDFKPGFGRKLIAGLAGMSAGFKNPLLGIKTARSIVDEPYNQALESHREEGKFVDDAVRLADSQQRRKIQSAEFSLRYDESKRAAQEREANSRRTRDEAERAARQREIDRDEDQKARAERDREMADVRREAADARNESLALRREMFDWQRTRASEGLDGGADRGKSQAPPKQSERDDMLKKNFMGGSDPRYKKVYDWPMTAKGFDDLDKTPMPRWVLEGREPTPEETFYYNQLQPSLEDDLQFDRFKQGRLYGPRRIR